MSPTSSRSPALGSPPRTPSAPPSAASSESQSAHPAPANPAAPPSANRAPAPSLVPRRPIQSARRVARRPLSSPHASSLRSAVPDAHGPPGPNPHPSVGNKKDCAENFVLSLVAA